MTTAAALAVGLWIGVNVGFLFVRFCFVCGAELRRWREPTHHNTAHNCDALPSKCTASAISGRDRDQAKQADWIDSSYRHTPYSRSGRGSADQHCACQRLSCRAQFARPGGQLVVLPIRLAYSTQMLVFAFAREAGATHD